jgi:hypothetical protein
MKAELAVGKAWITYNHNNGFLEFNSSYNTASIKYWLSAYDADVLWQEAVYKAILEPNDINNQNVVKTEKEAINAYIKIYYYYNDESWHQIIQHTSESVLANDDNKTEIKINDESIISLINVYRSLVKFNDTIDIWENIKYNKNDDIKQLEEYEKVLNKVIEYKRGLEYSLHTSKKVWNKLNKDTNKYINSNIFLMKKYSLVIWIYILISYIDINIKILKLKTREWFNKVSIIKYKIF